MALEGHQKWHSLFDLEAHMDIDVVSKVASVGTVHCHDYATSRQPKFYQCIE